MTPFKENRWQINLVFLLALGCIAIIGCGPSLPDTVKVHGTVTCNGAPLEIGTIFFEPTTKGDGTPLRAAKGYIEDGMYQLSCFRSNDGAMPGEYKVIVDSITKVPSINGGGFPPQSAIPRKYSRSDTTDLTASVPADGPSDVEINFDLVP